MSDRLDVAAGFISSYVELKQAIAVLEAKADEAKAAAIESLGADGAEVGHTWVFPGLARVEVTKGRVSEKLDRARLAKAGVAADVLDAATVRTAGAPIVRVVRVDPAAEVE